MEALSIITDAFSTKLFALDEIFLSAGEIWVKDIIPI